MQMRIATITYHVHQAIQLSVETEAHALEASSVLRLHLNHLLSLQPQNFQQLLCRLTHQVGQILKRGHRLIWPSFKAQLVLGLQYHHLNGHVF